MGNKKLYTTPHFTNYNYSYNFVTLHPIPLDYTTLPYIALHCTHYTTPHAPALNTHKHTLITLHHNYNSTLHPAAVGEVR